MTSSRGTILVVDDEEIMREILETLLTREGYDVRLASSGAEGLELARATPFDAAIVDIMMPGLDGIATLDELKRIDEDLAVLIITAYASVESAIAAMKNGAFDYITKPFKNDEVLVVVRNAMERRRLVHENRELRQNIQERYHKFGEHHRPEPADAAGVRPDHPGGAEPIDDPDQGRERHRQGARRAGDPRQLVARRPAVRRGQLRRPPPDLLESTLFGHVKGAFTGAVDPKKGLFELADKGSLFFDEIGNVPLETQAKLLRVIQEREFMRLGGMETIKVDVRIVAATNVDLRQMMEEGQFRRGSLLPAARHHDPAAAAARAQGRHPAAGAALPARIRRREPEGRPRADARRAGPADRLRLAGQRPRARERHRARGRAAAGTADRRRPDSRSRAQVAGLPDAAVRRAAGGHFVQGGHHRFREAADRVDARSGRRRAEAGGRAAAHQADDAERDDQALRHPSAPQATGDGTESAAGRIRRMPRRRWPRGAIGRSPGNQRLAVSDLGKDAFLLAEHDVPPVVPRARSRGRSGRAPRAAGVRDQELQHSTNSSRSA